MRANISNSLINTLKPTGKQYEIRDTRLKGFLIRVNAAGRMSYVCQYARGKRINIGQVGVISPIQAREKAIQVLSKYTEGESPKASKKECRDTSLGQFIENDYRPWVMANRKQGRQTYARIKAQFIKEFGIKNLTELSPYLLEKWRTNRLEQGKKKATVNRDMIALRAALSKAVEWQIIEHNPLLKLKPYKQDEIGIVRYLTQEEEARFRAAIDARERKIRDARQRANQWREKRGYNVLSSLQTPFVDSLKPMILLSINTGIRQGELFALKLEDVNFSLSILTIKGDNAKSSKTRHIPLNQEALSTLKQWVKQREELSCDSNLLFPNSKDGEWSTLRKKWGTLLKSANINKFRWHDMRHHFASRLVMAGVDLNTVRELLGHSDIKMTLRYAHLAPEHKAQAVAKLIS